MAMVRTTAATGVSTLDTVTYKASCPEAAAARFSTDSLPAPTVNVEPVDNAKAPDLSDPQTLMFTDVALADGLATTSCWVMPVLVPDTISDCFKAGATQEAAETPFKSPSVAQDITEEAAPVPSEADSNRVFCNWAPSSTVPDAMKISSSDPASSLFNTNDEVASSAPRSPTEERNTEPKDA